MKAIEVTAFGDADTIEVVERDVPEPREGQVRIDARAIGVNFADIMQRRGHYQGGPTPPYVPGMEVAGVVDAVGEGVDGFAEGDRVVGMVGRSGYAEYAVADADGLFDVPEGMSFEEAAGFPVQFLTAHNCLFEWGGLESEAEGENEGKRVLIHAAAGGVGTAAVQLASEAGAEVFGTASTAEKLDLAADLGCDHPINYVEADFAEEVSEITDGEGVDLVLDGVGGETTERSLDCLAHFGRMVVYGAASGEPGRPDTATLLFNNFEVVGYHLGQGLQRDPQRVLRAVPHLTELLTAGDLSVQVGHTFPLADAADAHRAIENRETSGKVVLVP
ncbi:quinone oxidoreductase family protein [Halomarina pelagica]|uniref:quinone oxidoreductase family protein n=1 Tax=Halomarina pelagica TaxID=2961599 RepID=UPI0020C41F38|nr:NADPH:quinone oxidoreductase family protein [Halomarina sp. BND7]